MLKKKRNKKIRIFCKNLIDEAKEKLHGNDLKRKEKETIQNCKANNKNNLLSLDNEAIEKVCETAKEKIKIIRESLDNEAKEKVFKAAKERIKTICEDLDDSAKRKLHKGNQKKQVLKIWMMKPQGKYIRQKKIKKNL